MNTKKSVAGPAVPGMVQQSKAKPRKDFGEMFIGYPGRFSHMPKQEAANGGDLSAAGHYISALAWALNWAAGCEEASWDGIKYDKPRLVLFVCPMKVEDKQILEAACYDEKVIVPVDKLPLAKRNTKVITCELQGKEFLAYLSRMINLVRPQNLIITPAEYYFRGNLKTAKQRILCEGGWATNLQKPRDPFDWKFKAEDSDYDSGDWWKT